MRIARDESGQTIPFVVVFLVVLIGMLALVVDVGSWFRAQRQLQTTADAAVLAGAYSLPDPLLAQSDATRYVTANVDANNTPATTIAFPAPTPPGGVCANNNCIAVELSHQASGLFAPVLNSVLSSVTVRAHAQAAIVSPGAVKNVAPIAIQQADVCQPALGCTFPYRPPQPLNFDTSGYQLIDLGRVDTTAPIGGSNASTSTMNSWIRTGDPSPLPAPAWYAQNNGAKTGVKQGLQDAADAGTTLLIPVFDRIDGPAPAGTGTMSVHVIGWAAFVIDSGSVTNQTWSPSNNGAHTLTGQFVRFIANGLPAGSGTPGENFGVVSIVVNG